jgi:hypothetical protein
MKGDINYRFLQACRTLAAKLNKEHNQKVKEQARKDKAQSK